MFMAKFSQYKWAEYFVYSAHKKLKLTVSLRLLLQGLAKLDGQVRLLSVSLHV